MRHGLTIQGTYYLITGVWPLVHYSSFEAVLGPKTDDWLVRMVALLTVGIGIALLLAARSARAGGSALVLAAATAIAFTTIDVIYATSGTIRRIYLADAVVEMGFLAMVLRRSVLERAR